LVGDATGDIEAFGFLGEMHTVYATRRALATMPNVVMVCVSVSSVVRSTSSSKFSSRITESTTTLTDDVAEVGDAMGAGCSTSKRKIESEHMGAAKLMRRSLM
jgi:hypothetical protein